MCWGGCGCEFSWDLGFCVSLQQAEMGAGWWVPAMTPGCTGWTQQGVFERNTSVCFICTDPWLLPPKKASWGKKKKSVTVGSISWVTFSFSPATSSPAWVMPLVFPTPFPGGCQNQGGGWEQGDSAGVSTAAKSSFGGGWQGGLSLFIWAQPLYSHGFLTRHAVNSRSPQTEEALAYLYCVLASAP